MKSKTPKYRCKRELEGVRGEINARRATERREEAEDLDLGFGAYIRRRMVEESSVQAEEPGEPISEDTADKNRG